MRGADGQEVIFNTDAAAVHQFRQQHGPHAPVPETLVAAADVSAEEQLGVMATVQSCVDNAVSKTVHLPASAKAQEVGLVLLQAWELGLKGCAVFREA